MSERPKYVSPEYQAQLDALAETLVTPERFGQLALDGSVQLSFDDHLEDTQEIPVVELGEN